MRGGAAVCLAALALFAARSASAQGVAPPVLDNTTPLFCKNDSGDIQPMQYASLGTVVRRYQARFAFAMSADPALTQMRFSNTETEFYISYKIEPYRDAQGRSGIAFLSMHVSLENADEDIDGTPMCYFTEFGK